MTGPRAGRRTPLAGGRAGGCALVATLAIGLAGCAGRASVAASPRGLSQPGLTGSEVALYAALLASADARHIDSALIHRGLASRAPAVRVAAARSVGQIQSRALAPEVRALLTDPDTAVAATAAYSLGLMHDSGGVASLATALHSAPTVAIEAAWSLGEIGGPARQAIEDALRDSVLRPMPRAAVLLASGKLRPVPVALVVSYLGAPGGGRAVAREPVVVRAAAHALSRPPAPAGVRALLAVAQSNDVETRLAVANALGRRAAGDSLGAPARVALGVLTQDSDAHVRALAVRSVSSYGDSARAVVVRALRDADANVRVAAGAVLDRVLGERRREWAAAFTADTSLAYRRGVVAAAVRSGVVLEAIDHDNADRWQRLGDWRYRAAAAEAATGTPIARVVDLALPLTRDPDGRVRAAAYGVFAPWLDSADTVKHPWRRDYMRQALHDADCIVRATALGALQSHALEADVGAAAESFTRARDDSQSDARVAAIGLLAAAWAHDSAHFSDAERQTVRELPVPVGGGALLELAAAGEGSVWTAWRVARTQAPPPRPRAWYDSVVRAVVLPSIAGRPFVVRIETVRGPMTWTLFGADAPLTVANFVGLVRAGYYRGTTLHRVVPGFVAQGGDPRGDGNGAPSDVIRDELNRRRYVGGAVGMALSGPDTGGSQYFVTLAAQPHLDGQYTVFGTVIDGYAALDRLVQGDSVTSISVR